MDRYKEGIIKTVEDIKDKLIEMSDFIHDNPELGNEEYKAVKVLTEFLEQDDFKVEMGVAGLPTAFTAVYNIKEGGPIIGLLCEYDALKGLGHGCAHNLQGPSIVGAAVSLSRNLGDLPAKIVVHGTPAEESESGKLIMLKKGLFDDLDVALMMHGGDRTTVDCKSLAINVFNFNFKGKAAHAAVAPEQGISALDGVMMTFNGIEYLREHVRDDVRIHGIVTNGGKAANIVPEEASAQFFIRAGDRLYLNKVIERVFNVVKGAALATGTTVEIERVQELDNKINVESLNRLLLDNARLVKAKNITPPRERTGSTDFSSVTYKMPGSCLRVAITPLDTSSHSEEWEKASGNSAGHEAVIIAAKALACTCIDLISNPDLLRQIEEEFKLAKGK